MLTGHDAFLSAVCDRLVDDLLRFALYRSSDPNPDRAKDMFSGPKAAAKYSIEFHQNLLACIKEWAEVHTFVDGSISKFQLALEKIQAAGVAIPRLNIDSQGYPEKKPAEEEKKHQKPRPAATPQPKEEPYVTPSGGSKAKSKSVTEGNELVLNVSQTMEVWTIDGDTAAYIKSQLKKVQEAIMKEVGTAADDQVEELIFLNDVLNNLPELMDKAQKRDKSAQQKIVQFANEIERKNRTPAHPAPSPAPAVNTAATRRKEQKKVPVAAVNLDDGTIPEAPAPKPVPVRQPPPAKKAEVVPDFDYDEEEKQPAPPDHFPPQHTVVPSKKPGPMSPPVPSRTNAFPSPEKEEVPALAQTWKVGNMNEFFSNIPASSNFEAGPDPSLGMFATNQNFPTPDAFQFGEESKPASAPAPIVETKARSGAPAEEPEGRPSAYFARPQPEPVPAATVSPMAAPPVGREEGYDESVCW